MIAYEWVVLGKYGHGWEDLTASSVREEARADLKAYRVNEPGIRHRMLRRKETPS